MSQLLQLGSHDRSNPQSILGFFAILTGVIAAGGVSTCGLLAWRKELHYLIPWVLGIGFAGMMLMGLLVLWLAKSDPTGLMLGRVSGTEYIENRKVGDSRSGERTVRIPGRIGVSLGGLEVIRGEVGEDASSDDEAEA